jgi:hypothetical protein
MGASINKSMQRDTMVPPRVRESEGRQTPAKRLARQMPRPAKQTEGADAHEAGDRRCDHAGESIVPHLTDGINPYLEQSRSEEQDSTSK